MFTKAKSILENVTRLERHLEEKDMTHVERMDAIGALIDYIEEYQEEMSELFNNEELDDIKERSYEEDLSETEELKLQTWEELYRIEKRLELVQDELKEILEQENQ